MQNMKKEKPGLSLTCTAGQSQHRAGVNVELVWKVPRGLAPSTFIPWVSGLGSADHSASTTPNQKISPTYFPLISCLRTEAPLYLSNSLECSPAHLKHENLNEFGVPHVINNLNLFVVKLPLPPGHCFQ